MSTKREQAKVKKFQKQCDEFNMKYPVGCKVLLKKDFVDIPVETTVRQPAFVLSKHSAVAFFENISGCYEIDCVIAKVNPESSNETRPI